MDTIACTWNVSHINVVYLNECYSLENHIQGKKWSEMLDSMQYFAAAIPCQQCFSVPVFMLHEDKVPCTKRLMYRTWIRASIRMHRAAVDDWLPCVSVALCGNVFCNYYFFFFLQIFILMYGLGCFVRPCWGLGRWLRKLSCGRNHDWTSATSLVADPAPCLMLTDVDNLFGVDMPK